MGFLEGCSACHRTLGGPTIATQIGLSLLASRRRRRCSSSACLRLRVAVKVPQLVQDKDYFTDSALRHADRANSLLVLDELRESLLASIY